MNFKKITYFLFLFFFHFKSFEYQVKKEIVSVKDEKEYEALVKQVNDFPLKERDEKKAKEKDLLKKEIPIKKTIKEKSIAIEEKAAPIALSIPIKKEKEELKDRKKPKKELLIQQGEKNFLKKLSNQLIKKGFGTVFYQKLKDFLFSETKKRKQKILKNKKLFSKEFKESLIYKDVENFLEYLENFLLIGIYKEKFEKSKDNFFLNFFKQIQKNDISFLLKDQKNEIKVFKDYEKKLKIDKKKDSIFYNKKWGYQIYFSPSDRFIKKTEDFIHIQLKEEKFIQNIFIAAGIRKNKDENLKDFLLELKKDYQKLWGSFDWNNIESLSEKENMKLKEKNIHTLLKNTGWAQNKKRVQHISLYLMESFSISSVFVFFLILSEGKDNKSIKKAAEEKFLLLFDNFKFIF